MLDVKSAYSPNTPASPKGLVPALVQVNDDLVEMHVFTKWYEGKRARYNLVRFGPNNILVLELRGWDGQFVQIIG